jgi:diguanylate cyclase (GGDEF)-like protein/PAS domain S-box-containing protein
MDLRLIKYRQLFETLADGVFVAQDYQFVFCNTALPSMLGYKQNEFIGLHFKQVVSPDFLNIWTELFDERIGSGNEPEKCYEAQLLRSDGNPIWVELRANRSEYNDLPAVLGTIREITDRKNSEIKLRLWADSFEHAEFGLAIADAITNRFIMVNPTFAKERGYTREELIGKSILTVFPDAIRDQVKSKISTVDSTSHIMFESQHLCKDGRQFPVLLDITAIYNEKGIAIRRIAYAIDISERKLAEQRLQESEERFRTMIQYAPEAIIVFDVLQELIIEANGNAEQLFECKLEELVKHSPLDFMQPVESDKIPISKSFLEHNERTLYGEQLVFERKVIGVNGKESICEVRLTNLPSSDRKLVRASMVDITARRKEEVNLSIAATAFETQEGMIVTDARSVILRVNNAFTQITGYTADEVIGHTPKLLKSGRHDSKFYKEMWHVIHTTGKWQGELWNQRKNGEAFPEWLNITAVKDKNGKVTNYVGSYIDITERKAADEKIQTLAYFDALTKLPNRRLLQDRLIHSMATIDRSKNRAALLLIDLDHFKDINDSLGHHFGDLLLQQVAERLNVCIREGDTVARLGGDEFVVLLEGLDSTELEAASQAKATATKILENLSQPYYVSERTIHNTSSIGIALFNFQVNDFESLLQQADIAMYQAKRAGRNTLRFFDPKMQEYIVARTELEREMRVAIEKHQFLLFYQIQVDQSDSPLGAEALIRWIHPERGMISPAEFIPLSEESSLIFPIGLWVMETACKQLKVWESHDMTKHLTLSINVSAKQFHQADFVSQVQSCIQTYGIKPNLLKLELTESMLVEDVEDTIAKMTELRTLGVCLSLDDFGTGYSSLQYLKRLPLDQLKIDQSFVRDIMNDSNDKAIVKTIITMAVGLGLSVIAEGIETEDQFNILKTQGCETFQGYYFGKPIPIDQFESSLPLI